MTTMQTAAAWAIGPDVTVAYAADTHGQLMAALPAMVGNPRLDLSAVTDFDSSGVQLLMALRASLADKGQTLQLVAPSAVVRNALDTFGLLAQFSIAPAEPNH
jgi:anti-anti-sigma regulatory factor